MRIFEKAFPNHGDFWTQFCTLVDAAPLQCLGEAFAHSLIRERKGAEEVLLRDRLLLGMDLCGPMRRFGFVAGKLVGEHGDHANEAVRAGCARGARCGC